MEPPADAADEALLPGTGPLPIVIRQPLSTRLIVAAFVTFWASLPLSGAARALARGELGRSEVPALLFLFAFVSAGVFIGRSMYRLAVVADANGMTIKNHWKTWRLPWDDVAGFKYVGGLRLVGRIEVVTHDGRVIPVDVTEGAGRSWLTAMRDEFELARERAAGSPLREAWNWPDDQDSSTA